MNEQLTNTPTHNEVPQSVLASAASTEKTNSGALNAGNIAVAGAALAAGTVFLSAKRANAITPALTFEANIPGTGVTKALNYALALEDLETELYIQALQRLTTGGNGGPTAVNGLRLAGLGAPASAQDVEYIRIFGKVETEHSTFLRNLLGRNAIAPLRYDFGFATANRRRVDEIVYDAEFTGVGAYLGAVPFLAGADVPTLRIAAAILGTEARHTAVFADILNDMFGTRTPVAPPFNVNNGRDKPVSPNETLAHVSPFIFLPA